MRFDRFIFVVAICVIGGVGQASSFPSPDWPISTPEKQGMSAAVLADLVDYGKANRMDSLLVIRHGQMVLEVHYPPFRPGLKHAVNSTTKAIVGSLAGIAFKEGALGPLDQKVLEQFPDRKISNVDVRKNSITLNNLLDMNSGLDWQEPLTDEVPVTMLQMTRSNNWIDFVLDRPMAQPPGLSFAYDSGTWHLLSVIVGKKTKQDTFEFAKQKLFTPLGITDVTWTRDPQGNPIGGWGVFMLPRDMAKIGYLYLNKGNWAGKQLLDSTWVDKVLNASVKMNLAGRMDFRYANGWWTLPEKRAYMASGFLGQLIVVMPDSDVVAVVTGKGFRRVDQLVDRIAASVKSELPSLTDESSSKKLAERVSLAETETPTEVGPVSPLASTISGKSFRFEPNGIGLKSLTLNLVGTEQSFEAVFGQNRADLADARYAGPIGMNGYFGKSQPIAVKGRWLNDADFRITAQSLLDGVVTTMTLTFHGGQVDASIVDNRGMRTRAHGKSGS